MWIALLPHLHRLPQFYTSTPVTLIPCSFRIYQVNLYALFLSSSGLCAVILHGKLACACFLLWNAEVLSISDRSDLLFFLMKEGSSVLSKKLVLFRVHAMLAPLFFIENFFPGIVRRFMSRILHPTGPSRKHDCFLRNARSLMSGRSMQGSSGSSWGRGVIAKPFDWPWKGSDGGWPS